MRQRRIEFLVLALIMLVTVVTFSRTFTTGYFTWDDNTFITDDVALRMPFTQALETAFTKPFLYDYLPLTIMSFWTDVHVFGYRPGIQHAENLAVHLLNIFLLFLLLRRLGFRKEWVWALCALFAFHPVQTEPIMWVSNRNTFFATAFLLGSFLCEEEYWVSRRKTLYFSLMTVFYLVAFLFKAAGILLPVLFVLMAVVYHGDSVKKALKRFAMLFVACAGALVLRSRFYVSGAGGKLVAASAFDPDRLMKLPVTVLNAIGLYIKMVFFPNEYSLFYPPFELNTASVVASVLVLALMVLIFVTYRRTKNKDYFFFAGVILVFLLPVLQIFPRNNYINDRYLYFPIIGFAGLALALARDLKLPSFLYLWGVLFILALPPIAFDRTSVWKNDETLWSDTIKHIPYSALARNNLGLAYIRSGKIPEAVKVYEEALSLPFFDVSPTFLYNNLGSIYLNQTTGSYHDPRKAAETFAEGIKHAPLLENTFDLRFNLGEALAVLGRQDEAVSTWKALRDDVNAFPDQRYKHLLGDIEAELSKYQ